MTSHLLTPTHCSSAIPNIITVHTKGIRPSFQQYTASTNVTITDYITTLLWGNWHQQLYHVYPTWSQQSWFEDNEYTYYSFNTLSHPGFGRSHWKTREVSDGRCYGRSYAPSTIVWETWIHNELHSHSFHLLLSSSDVMKPFFETWKQFNKRNTASDIPNLKLFSLELD